MSLAPVLSAPIFQWFIPAQNGTGLVPAVGYVVQFYQVGTAIPKTVYTDPALTIPYPSPSNKVTLNSQGYATIYLGSGGYKLTVSTPSGSVVFVQDNIVSNGSFGTGFVNIIADLAGIDTNLNTFTFVGGYYASGDGGEGMFFNKVSVESANGGYIFDSSFDPSKKWYRISQGDVYAAYFGYIPGNAGDQTSQLIAADAYAATLWSARLVIQSGNLATVTAITFNSPVIVMQPGAQFNAASAVTLTFRGLMDAYGAYTNTSVGPGIFQIFGTNITAILSASTIAIPEWFGATTASSDNKPAFDKLWASGAGGYEINPGIWLVSTTTPPNFVRILSFGTVWDGTTTFIPIGEYFFNASQIQALGNISAGGNITTGTGTVSGLNITSGNNISAANNISAENDVLALRDGVFTRDITAGRNAVITGNTTSAEFIESAHPAGMGYWTPYTPTLTLSNGSPPSNVAGLSASFMSIGKTIFIRFIIGRFDIDNSNNKSIPRLTIPSGFTFRIVSIVGHAACSASYSFNNGASAGATNCDSDDNTHFLATAYGFGDGSGSYTLNSFSGMLIAEIN